MRILSQKHLRKSGLAALLATAVIPALLLIGATKAESGWWQKGLDLLKGSGSTTGSTLTSEEIGFGLKDALRVGSEAVVRQLGRKDGFNLDPAVHLELPAKLATVQDWLGKVGMASMLDDLELRLNRAAEAATPKARDLFLNAISEMTFEDVMNIYKGPDDAATRYFQDRMSGPLSEEMSPIVSDSLSDVGAIKSYDNIMKEYRSIPFAPDVKADLTDYVVEKGIDGIFHYIAVEEAAIRQNPAKRTTELLRKVFGSQ